MTVAIRQIHSVFTGEVSGIDITSPLTRDEVAAIEAGMDLADGDGHQSTERTRPPSTRIVVPVM